MQLYLLRELVYRSNFTAITMYRFQLACVFRYAQLVAAGDKNLHYVRTEQLFAAAAGGGLDTPTAAGLHPTEDGIWSVAQFWTGYLPTIL
jgi:hypothetical protein